MKINFKWLIVLVVTFIAIITNPKKQQHIDKVKEYAIKELPKFQNIDTNDAEAAGSVIGWNIGMAYLENIVSVDNYLLFSLTKLNYKGKSRIIGIGAFGNVWIK